MGRTESDKERMNYIDNVSAGAIPIANHYDVGNNSMLIQITDPAKEFPVPKYKFKEVHQFEFLDIGDNDPDPGLAEFEMTEAQAKQIVDLLKHALEERMNVLVHCQMGICRSGAVVEVAEMMGFTQFDTYRIPNTRVKRLMMRELGLTYDATNEPYDAIRDRLNE